VRPLTIPVAFLFAASALGLAGCKSEGGGDVTPDSTAAPNVPEGQVLVKSISFNPRELRTTVGKAVTWVFDDGGLEHTVTGDNNEFDSGRMSSGTFKHAFTAAGTFNYHCQVHARMHGTVIVTG
jgi:plastocyanin